MKPESDNDPLIDALRADLPNEEQSARLRARLAALGIATAGALTTSSALAAGAAKTASELGMAAGAAKTASELGVAASALARLSALPIGVKVGVAGVVCGALIGAPAVIVSSSKPLAETASMSASARRPAPRATIAPSEPVVTRAVASDAAAPQASPIAEPPTRVNAAPVKAPLALNRPVAPAPAARAVDAQESPRAAFEERAPALATGVASAGESATAGAVIDDAPAVAPSRVPVATTLAEETALMDRAFSALRTGDRDLALRLVREHERRFPDGLLRRERERARGVLARSNGQ